MEKSPSFLASESEHAQKTKKFGEFGCQILTGSGLMNAKTFQRLINHLSQKLFHRKSRRHIPAPTCYSRRHDLLPNSKVIVYVFFKCFILKQKKDIILTTKQEVDVQCILIVNTWKFLKSKSKLVIMAITITLTDKQVPPTPSSTRV